MSDYKSEKKWRQEHKERLIKRASQAKTVRSFMQIMKLVGEHAQEISKIDKILKDGRAW